MMESRGERNYYFRCKIFRLVSNLSYSLSYFLNEERVTANVTQEMNKWIVLCAKFIKIVCATRELNNVERTTRTIKSYIKTKT